MAELRATLEQLVSSPETTYWGNIHPARPLFLRFVALVIAICSCGPIENQAVANDGPEKAIEKLADDRTNLKATQWKTLLSKLREQELRFQSYSATVKLIRNFGGPANLSATSICRQTIDGQKFHLVGEDIHTHPAGDPTASKRLVICDGQQTVAIEEGSNATKYAAREEPWQLAPPHAWGMFNLAVNFPLSIYLEGTETIAAYPKVGRTVGMGSIYEFPRVEAQIVDENIVDGRDCIVVRVKRWYRASDTPVHQYLWLAKDRNLHVCQTRTALARSDEEIPQTESRVASWHNLGDGIWVPKEVEVVSISPQAVASKTTTVTELLIVEAVECNPVLPDGTFALPPIPEDLPQLSVSAENRLVNSPHHPVPMGPEKSTNLDAILARMEEEEKKYIPIELVSNQDYSFRNGAEGVQHVVRATQWRQRSVILSDRRYFEDAQVSSNAETKTSSNQQMAFDGKVRRTISSYGTSDSMRHSAQFEYSEKPMQGSDSHVWQGAPRTLAEYLRSGSKDKERSKPSEFDGNASFILEYVGDDRIDELVCHKLKCDMLGVVLYVWVARDRNLFPIRKEAHEPRWHASLPTGIYFCEDLRELKPGVWYPFRATELAFQKSSRDGLNANQMNLQWRRETTVEQVLLNPRVEDSLFSQIEVPAKTKISISKGGKPIGTLVQAVTGDLEVSEEQLQELNHQADGNRPVRDEPINENHLNSIACRGIAVNHPPPNC